MIGAKAYYTLGLARVQNDDNRNFSLAKAVELNATNAVAWNDYGVVLNELKTMKKHSRLLMKR